MARATKGSAKQRPASKPAAPPRAPIAAAVEQALKRSSTPHVLLGYQQDWVRDQADVGLWEKSRRIGASWTDAADSVLTAGREGGMDALYIGYSEDMTKEYIEDCAMWAKAFSLAAGEAQETLFVEEDENGEKNSIKAFRIDFASGRKILALSSRPRSIRGKQGKVTIDEAAFHDDLPGLMKAALAMLIWGGRVRLLSSHNGEDNYWNLLLKEVRAGKLPYSLHKTTFADALEAGLYERVKLIMGARLKQKTRPEWEAAIREQYGEDAAEELDCIPKQGSGVYIPRTLVERAQVDGVPVIRYSKQPGYELHDGRLVEAASWFIDTLKPMIDSLPNVRSVAGQDFGRSGDLSYLTVLLDEGAGRWREGFNLEMRGIPFDVQHQVVVAVLDALPLFHHAKLDARGNGQAHAEALLQKYGPARIECVMATPTWYAVNFPPYKAALEDKSVAIAKGEDVIADHRRVILKNGYPAMDDGKDKGSDGKQRHGDGAIARVLAWAATRAEGEPPAGESIAPDYDAFTPERMRDRRRTTMFRKAA